MVTDPGFVSEDAGEFDHGRARDNDLAGFGQSGLGRGAADGQAITVGGGELDVVRAEGEADAGEHGPAVILRGGHDHLLDDGGPDAGWHLEFALGVALGHWRELVGVDALHLGAEASGGDLERVGLGVEFKGDDAFGQLADEVGEQARGNGDGAFRLDAGAGPDGDGHLLVHGGQLETAVLSCQQDVAEHGQRAAGGDGPADEA